MCRSNSHTVCDWSLDDDWSRDTNYYAEGSNSNKCHVTETHTCSFDQLKLFNCVFWEDDCHFGKLLNIIDVTWHFSMSATVDQWTYLHSWIRYSPRKIGIEMLAKADSTTSTAQIIRNVALEWYENRLLAIELCLHVFNQTSISNTTLLCTSPVISQEERRSLVFNDENKFYFHENDGHLDERCKSRKRHHREYICQH